MAQRTYNPRTGREETLDQMIKQGRVERAKAARRLFQGLRQALAPKQAVSRDTESWPYQGIA